MLTRILSLASDLRTIANTILGDLGQSDLAIDPRVTVRVMEDTGTRIVTMPCVGNVQATTDGRLSQCIRADRVDDAILTFKEAAKALEGAR